jgi:hypothetical protein
VVATTPISWDEESVAFAEGRESEACWSGLARTLRPMVIARLGVLRAECDDVLSETFLDLVELRARGRYDPARGPVPALARSIAERRCADRLRRTYRHPTRSLDEPAGEGGPPLPADPAPGVEQQVVHAETLRARREAFGRAFRDLQRADRAHGSRRALAVLLRHRLAIQEDDFTFLVESRPRRDLASWEEVAGQLGMTEEAARQNGSRGLGLLRERWRAHLPVGIDE